MAHKPISTLGRFMPRRKDRPTRGRVQGVVYKIPCADCSATYFGETKNFHERILQHKNDARNFDPERSAVAEHSYVKEYRIDFGNIRSIDIEPNPRPRLLLESWHIQTMPRNINRSLGDLQLSHVNGLCHITDAKRRAPVDEGKVPQHCSLTAIATVTAEESK